MQKETITRIKLTASEGMALTNGREFCKVAYLAAGDSGDGWYEISEEEYLEIMKENEEDE